MCSREIPCLFIQNKYNFVQLLILVFVLHNYISCQMASSRAFEKLWVFFGMITWKVWTFYMLSQLTVFFLYRILVNFICIKVNLPHSRDLNEGVHVIVQTHLILIFQNQTFLAQYFFIWPSTTKTKWQYWSRGLEDPNIFLIRLRLKFCTNKF